MGWWSSDEVLRERGLCGTTVTYGMGHDTARWVCIREPHDGPCAMELDEVARLPGGALYDEKHEAKVNEAVDSILRHLVPLCLETGSPMSFYGPDGDYMPRTLPAQHWLWQGLHNDCPVCYRHTLYRRVASHRWACDNCAFRHSGSWLDQKAVLQSAAIYKRYR